MIKFELGPRFGVIEEQLDGYGPGMSNIGILRNIGKGSSKRDVLEECDGMLRIWDGPLREPPICKDLNW